MSCREGSERQLNEKEREGWSTEACHYGSVWTLYRISSPILRLSQWYSVLVLVSPAKCLAFLFEKPNSEINTVYHLQLGKNTFSILTCGILQCVPNTWALLYFSYIYISYDEFSSKVLWIITLKLCRIVIFMLTSLIGIRYCRIYEDKMWCISAAHLLSDHLKAEFYSQFNSRACGIHKKTPMYDQEAWWRVLLYVYILHYLAETDDGQWQQH